MLQVCGGAVTADSTALNGVASYDSSTRVVLVFCSCADTVYWLCWWYCSACVCAGYSAVCLAKSLCETIVIFCG